MASALTVLATILSYNRGHLVLLFSTALWSAPGIGAWLRSSRVFGWPARAVNAAGSPRLDRVWMALFWVLAIVMAAASGGYGYDPYLTFWSCHRAWVLLFSIANHRRVFPWIREHRVFVALFVVAIACGVYFSTRARRSLGVTTAVSIASLVIYPVISRLFVF